jgi:hypothetical protein
VNVKVKYPEWKLKRGGTGYPRRQASIVSRAAANYNARPSRFRLPVQRNPTVAGCIRSSYNSLVKQCDEAEAGR